MQFYYYIVVSIANDKGNRLLPIRLASVRRAKGVGNHRPWIASQSLKSPGKNLRTWRGHRSGTRTLSNLEVYILLLRPPTSNAKLPFRQPPPKATVCFSQHCPEWKFLEAFPQRNCVLLPSRHTKISPHHPFPHAAPRPKKLPSPPDLPGGAQALPSHRRPPIEAVRLPWSSSSCPRDTQLFSASPSVCTLFLQPHHYINMMHETVDGDTATPAAVPAAL